MPTNTTDQQIPLPAGTDSADNPVAFTNDTAAVEPRLVRLYTNEADRTARMATLLENNISALAAEDRLDVWNGTTHISLYARSLLTARKSADQTLTQNTTVLQNVTTLVFPVPATGVFAFRGLIYYSGSAVADVKVAFSIPAAGALAWHGLGVVTGSGASGDANFAVTIGGGTATAFGSIAVGTVSAIRIEGSYEGGGTAGSLQCQAAQNTAELTNTVIHSNSRLEMWRIS
jgi:hypothetical protein